MCKLRRVSTTLRLHLATFTVNNSIQPGPEKAKFSSTLGSDFFILRGRWRDSHRARYLVTDPLDTYYLDYHCQHHDAIWLVAFV